MFRFNASNDRNVVYMYIYDDKMGKIIIEIVEKVGWAKQSA